ncbi:hypothetical protein ODR03_16010, partial [Escherichia coli]|nr:hypothetical protein [Escherichia coli]
KNFVEQVQKMWRTGKRLYGNASDLVTMIKTLSGVSLGSDLQPRGVWNPRSSACGCPDAGAGSAHHH